MTNKVPDGNGDDGVTIGSRSSKLFVTLCSVALLSVLALGTVVLPLLRVPDEKFHADMVVFTQEGDWLETGWPQPSERMLDSSIIRATHLLLAFPKAHSRVVERGHRLGLQRLNLDDSRSIENRAAQHPPFAYFAAGAVSWLVTSSGEPDFVMLLWSFRLVSVLAAAALPVIFYLIARELSGNRWVHLASAAMPLAIPGITLRDAPMINTDATLILTASLSTLFAIKVSRGDLRISGSILLGVSVGLGALTKGHALIVLPVVIAAYVVQAVQARRVTFELVRSAAISGGMSLAIGGWWWLRNLVVYGAIQPLNHPFPPPEGFVPDWGHWFAAAVQRIVGSFWGGSYALPSASYNALMWLLFCLFIVAGIVGFVKSKDRASSGVAIALFVSLLLAVLFTSAVLYLDRGKVAGVQGRYLYPGVAGVVPLALMAAAGMLRRFRRWLPLLVVAGAVALTSLALRSMLSRFWSLFGPDLADRWAGVLAWSPFPSVITNGILAMSLLALSALLVHATWLGVRYRTDAPSVVTTGDLSLGKSV